MSNLSRREFVAGAIAGVACSLTIKGTAFGQTTRPGGPATKPVAGAFDAGEVASLKDGFNATPGATAKKVVLVKKGDKVYAVTAVCTHQGGSLKVMGESLRCSKHGAMFDTDGKVTKGPAKSDLARYGVSLKAGHIWVDTSKILLPGDFEKEGSFVTVA